jgi:hypothetical protein
MKTVQPSRVNNTIPRRDFKTLCIVAGVRLFTSKTISSAAEPRYEYFDGKFKRNGPLFVPKITDSDGARHIACDENRLFTIFYNVFKCSMVLDKDN